MLTVTDRRRFQRVIVRRFQLKFVLANLLFLCLAVVVFIGVVFGPVVVRLLDASGPFEDRAAVADVFLALHARIWFGIVPLFLLATLRLAVMSHRVAGPLVRFTKVFDEVRRGDVSMRVRVRKHDYLREEAAAFDRMVRSLRRRFQAVRGRSARLQAALKALRAAIPERERAGLHEALRAVEYEAARLRRPLDGLRTRPQEVAPGRPLHTARESGTGTRSSARGPSSTDTAPRLSPAARGKRGFTLVELLVVVAIIGTLVAIGAPTYVEALNQAKIVRAMGDIRSIGIDLMQYEIRLGELPDTLAEAGVTTVLDPWGTPYEYVRIRGGKKGKGDVRKDHKLNPLNSDFDLYSMGRDRDSKTQITNKLSLDDIIRASDGGFVGVASQY
jgi:general secretion pathway protein G